MIIMCRHGAYDIKELRGLGKTLGLVYTKNLTLKRRLKKMNFLQTKLNEMKKRKEEGNKGFSLVELIIVIAIMAILVGIVGTQVIPYLNKSKESKDLQIINSFSTAAVTAYSENAEDITSDITVDVYKTGLTGNEKTIADEVIGKTYKTLDDVKDKLKSKNGKNLTKIEITISVSTKKVTTQAYYKGTETGATEQKFLKAVEADL